MAQKQNQITPTQYIHILQAVDTGMITQVHGIHLDAWFVSITSNIFQKQICSIFLDGLGITLTVTVA